MARKSKQTKPITGEALITKVKQLSDLTREEKAKACGYTSNESDGSERIKVMAFLNALLDAEGINLDRHSSDGDGRGGRKASYKVSVQSNGNILVGRTYTKALELEPGDEFEITVGRKHIHLNKVA